MADVLDLVLPPPPPVPMPADYEERWMRCHRCGYCAPVLGFAPHRNPQFLYPDTMFGRYSNDDRAHVVICRFCEQRPRIKSMLDSDDGNNAALWHTTPPPIDMFHYTSWRQCKTPRALRRNLKAAALAKIASEPFRRKGYPAPGYGV